MRRAGIILGLLMAIGDTDASDQPDATKIEAKVREIEKLQGDQRMAFIRAVGQAAKVPTDEQRKALLGTVEKKVEPNAGESKN